MSKPMPKVNRDWSALRTILALSAVQCCAPRVARIPAASADAEVASQGAVASAAAVVSAPSPPNPPPRASAESERPSTQSRIGQRTPCPVDMVFVPGSTVQLGSVFVGASSLHSVTLGSYCIDRFPITNRDYEGCVAAGACGSRPPSCPLANDAEYAATCIDRSEAESLCKWRGRRLPSTDEWELAARGMDGRRFPWGDSRDKAKWPSRGGHEPVGTHALDVSPFGARDMGQSLMEWTATIDTVRSPALPAPAGASANYVVHGVEEAASTIVFPGATRGPGLGARCVVSVAADQRGG